MAWGLSPSLWTTAAGNCLVQLLATLENGSVRKESPQTGCGESQDWGGREERAWASSTAVPLVRQQRTVELGLMWGQSSDPLPPQPPKQGSRAL